MNRRERRMQMRRQAAASGRTAALLKLRPPPGLAPPLAAALAQAQMALQARPDDIPTLVAFAQAADRAGLRDAAVTAYRRCLEINPQLHAIRHLVHALSGEGMLPRAPDEYLRWVFDNAAPVFDRELRSLQYQGPEMALAAFQAVAGVDAPPQRIIDQGCGTGLNATVFERYIGLIDGIDVAPRMLEQARARKLYDRLLLGEIADVLARSDRCYSLALSTDVLIYIGEIAPCFAATYRVLEPGGLFVLTVEMSDDAPVKLMPSGRYRQSDAHIRATGEAAGFRLEHVAFAPLRIERGREEPGGAYVFRKPADAGGEAEPAKEAGREAGGVQEVRGEEGKE